VNLQLRIPSASQLERVPATLAPVMRASLRRWPQPCQDRDVSRSNAEFQAIDDRALA
jgi:hypothetical protein